MRRPVIEKLIGKGGDLAFENRFVALAGRSIDAGPISPVGRDIYAKLFLPRPTVQVGVVDFLVVVKDVATDLLEVLIAEPIQIDQHFRHTRLDQAWLSGFRLFFFLFWSSHLGVFNSDSWLLVQLFLDSGHAQL